MLATLLKPTGGRATLAGYDVATQPNEVRQSIGLVFQDQSLDNRLTADENLQVPRDAVRRPERRLPASAPIRCCKMVDLTDRRELAS